MRILLVTEAASAGVGRHVIDLAHGLAAGGHTVHVAYSPIRQDARFKSGLLDARLTSHRIPMRRSPHPTDVFAVRQLRKLIQRYGPFDIVHGHSSKGGAIARLSAVGLRIPVVYTPHAFVGMNPELSRLSSACFIAAEKMMAPMTRAIVAVSEDEKDQILRCGIRAEELRVVHNGIAPPPFARSEDVRARLSLPADADVIGFVGRFAAQKDPMFLIEAFKLIERMFPASILVMAGDGPLLEPASARIRELGLADRVRLIGSIPAEDILSAFDVFALPSLYEAMPYVLVEAVHAGLPVVTTSVASASLLVQDERSGLIVKSRTPQDFSVALGRLLADRQLRIRFGEATLNHALAFTEDAMVAETVEVYQSVQRELLLASA